MKLDWLLDRQQEADHPWGAGLVFAAVCGAVNLLALLALGASGTTIVLTSAGLIAMGTACARIRRTNYVVSRSIRQPRTLLVAAAFALTLGVVALLTLAVSATLAIFVAEVVAVIWVSFAPASSVRRQSASIR
jgi:hypothetical protein